MLPAVFNEDLFFAAYIGLAVLRVSRFSLGYESQCGRQPRWAYVPADGRVFTVVGLSQCVATNEDVGYAQDAVRVFGLFRWVGDQAAVQVALASPERAVRVGAVGWVEVEV